uniref:Uncharacterized protein n=1 Tax=Anguilla anguilla TaxID=7936 RepID=A0A0E9S5Y4_ANGAN
MWMLKILIKLLSIEVTHVKFYFLLFKNTYFLFRFQFIG